VLIKTFGERKRNETMDLFPSKKETIPKNGIRGFDLLFFLEGPVSAGFKEGHGSIIISEGKSAGMNWKKIIFSN